MSHNPARSVEVEGGRSRGWERFCRGLRTSRTTFRGWKGVWRGLGDLGGKSASLACPRTLARTVELWGVRADVWEGVWRGLERFGDSGGSGKTLARTVEMWEVRAAVFWGSGAGLVALKRSRGCGTVGGPSGGLEQQPPTNSTSRLQHTAGQASGGVGSEQSLPESDLAKTIRGLGEGYPRLWNCGGCERGSGTTTPYKLHQQTPVHRRGGQRGGRV